MENEKNLDSFNNYLYLYNIINFHLNIIKKKIYHDNSFFLQNSNLQYIIFSEEVIIELFLKDSLYYSIIKNYIKDNLEELTNRNNDILNMISKYNNSLEEIWNYIKNFIFLNDDYKNIDDYYFFKNNNIILKKEIIENINLDKYNYFNYIYSNLYLININNTKNTYVDINLMSKQLIILYFYCYFDQKKNKDDILSFFIEDPLYNEYNISLIKYKHVYIKNDNNELKFIKNNNINNINNILLNNDFDIKILYFFQTCIDNMIVNKNIISWFYILFKEKINKELHDDFFSLIFNVNKNLNGYINNILNILDIDIYNINKNDLEHLITRINKRHLYISKLNDNINFDNNSINEEIINNLNIIEKMKKINNKIYFFYNNMENIKNFNTDLISYFFNISPLDCSIEEFINKSELLYNNIKNKIKNTEIKDLFKLYNINEIDFNDDINNLNIIFTEKKIIKISIKDLYKEIKNVDIEILFYNFLKFLYNNKLFFNFNKSFNDNLKNNLLQLEKINKIFFDIYPKYKDII